MRHFKKQTAVVVIIVIALTLIAPVQAAAASIGEREISSRGAFVMDFETGITLFGYEADTPMTPASMTKLIAVYVVYDAIRAGEISLDSVAKISKGISELSRNREYSNVPLQEEESVTVRELLDVTIVSSACAAAAALGEALCGSEEAFVERMNEKLARLGIDARFFDCYGVSANNKISPRGMAKMTRYLILNHPEVLETASKTSVKFRNVEYKNTNHLLGEYTGADGLKTGYTDAAMYCLTATATQWGRRVIAVTMGSSLKERFPDAKTMLDYGFASANDTIAEFRSNSRATPSDANLILNGDAMPLVAYLIEGSHYFRLRDIAFLLRDTDSMFDVTWDNEERIVSILSGISYSDEDGVLAAIGEEARQFIPTTARFFIDYVEYALDVYSIEGYNYFKLRDLGRLIGFDVDWVEDTRTVIIENNMMSVR